MGLRLVYGLKTDDQGYLASFYPSRRLAEAAAMLGLDYAATVFGPRGSVDEALGFCAGHVALLRGELPESLGERLESCGCVVVNPPRATALADDKLATAAFLARAGAAYPATSGLDATGALPLPLPFVCKPRFGRMGRGLRLIEGAADWEDFQASGLAQREPYLAQAYVEASRGRDIRFFFADLGATDVVVVERRGSGLESNAHRGGSMRAYTAPAPLLEEARRLFALSGLVYGSVDFLVACEEGQAFQVCELNASPGFEALEATLGLDAAAAILRSAALASKARPSGQSDPTRRLDHDL